jgi:iron(III) transport system permease protein
MLKKRFRHLNIFSILSIVIGVLILLPLINILFELFTPATDTWIHIRDFLLLEYIKNTVLLVIITTTIALFIGFISAYFVARYEFKGRRLMSWMLVLPLAMPSYIAGYIYADMTSYSGTITRFFEFLGLGFNFDIMNVFGASFIFAFTLYPYIYLISLASLSRQSASYVESSTMLGASKWRNLFKITLPLLRPALVAGSLLVILETLNDYGLVHYFNVRVFSFAIFNAWFSLGDVVSAIRLSAYLMIIVFAVILVEKALRGRKRYQIHVKSKEIIRKKLSFKHQFFVIMILIMILMFGFFIPVLQMLWYMLLTFKDTLSIELIYASYHSVVNAIVAAIIIVFIALIMTNFNRLKSRSKLSKTWVKISNLGYAIPGAVIAVAIHLFFVDLDRILYPVYKIFNSNSPTLVITMSIFTLVFSYVLRFLSIGFNSIESQYEKTGEKFTESAYMLGSSKLEALVRIDLPIIYPGLITAFILVFIDIIKELPLTLILRPANYDSLSTLVYVYARNEMIQESAVPSLILIFIAGLLIYGITHYRKGMFSHVY